MFFFPRTHALASLVAVLLLVKNASAQECKSDDDCSENWDCVRTGFKKFCFPANCAWAGMEAMRDAGFDSDAWVANVRASAQMDGATDFMRVSLDQHFQLGEAFAANRPPMEAFNDAYSNCAWPNGERRLQSDETFYGLQWSGAAAFSYFGKSTWGDISGVNFQILSNCVGFLAGGDVGLDFLIQIFVNPNNFAPTIDEISTNSTSSKQITQNFNFQYVPVFIVGPPGIMVGWETESGPDQTQIVEITFGPSVGAALGGFSHCFTDITANV